MAENIMRALSRYAPDLLLLLALFTLSDCGENPENQGQNQ